MSSQKKKAFADYHVGDTASLTKVISKELVYAFAELIGDFNPVHVNEEFAKTTMFKKNIAHGVYSNGMISAVIGMKLIGPGALYLDQYVKYLKPVFIGDTMRATATILEKVVKERPGKPPMNTLILQTDVYNQENVKVTEGKATVMILE